MHNIMNNSDEHIYEYLVMYAIFGSGRVGTITKNIESSIELIQSSMKLKNTSRSTCIQ